jgi:hypothetical protein
MKIVKNRGGTILIATYLVLFAIIIVAGAFFTLVIHNSQSVTRQNDSAKALNFAEKGLSYVFFESYNSGWNWRTHAWNTAKTKLEPIDSEDQQVLRPDCSFDADGFYVANNGEFMIKAYADSNRDNDTVVLAMGISGTERRVIMYYMTQRGIYDFFVYSPYTLNLAGAVGRFPKMNGGGIHSNGDIYLNDLMRLEDISELSTGETGNIYYTGSQYQAPYFADNIDGVMDGKAPITRLDQLNDIWRDDSIPNAGPFGSYNVAGQWQWKSSANYFVSDSMGNWPTNSFVSSDYHFAGASGTESRYNVAPGKTDWYGFKNDGSGPLNQYNVWIKPYTQDESGNQVPTTWTQIPGELDEQWSWSKYAGNSYGTGAAKLEQPTSFYTYDGIGNKVDVAATYWEIKGNKVEWVDPLDLATHPNAKSYWDMFQRQDYWKAVRNDTVYAERINPEALDGTYGDERPSGGTLLVKNTNSKAQASSWKQFLEDSKLEGIVRDGNTGGKYLAPPDFSTTYSRKAAKDGLYIGLTDEAYEKDPAWQTNAGLTVTSWQKALEDSIDAAVVLLNKDTAKDVAKKVKFINTFTGQWNTVLELNLENMQSEGKTPNNGIVYSKVPIRLTQTETLPRAKANYGFTVLGEENIYFQGDYNTNSWVSSAVISKKRVFTFSEDFNDPQVKPATQHYRDYPYMYVKKVAGEYVESNPAKGGGSWVYRSYLDNDGIPDKIDWYANISDVNEQHLLNDINSKDSQYRAIFNKTDASGTASATFSWPDSGENYTYGMMPNAVTKDMTVSCLIAGRRWLDSNQSNRGDILENWGTKKRLYNGSYFVLEDSGFTATNNEYVDYVGKLPYDARGELSPTSTYSGAYYLPSYTAYNYIQMQYDKRFKTATRSPSDIFFGGAESLWAETTEALFAQMDF